MHNSFVCNSNNATALSLGWRLPRRLLLPYWYWCIRQLSLPKRDLLEWNSCNIIEQLCWMLVWTLLSKWRDGISIDMSKGRQTFQILSRLSCHVHSVLFWRELFVSRVWPNHNLVLREHMVILRVWKARRNVHLVMGDISAPDLITRNQLDLAELDIIVLAEQHQL